MILGCRELGSSVGESHMMAAAEARGMWQRTAAKCHMVKEDAALRSPKFVQCGLPRIVSRSPADTCHLAGFPNFLTSTWGSVDLRLTPESKVDLQWQFSPSGLSERSGADANASGLRFSKPAAGLQNLQSLAADGHLHSATKAGSGSTGTDSECSAAELDFEWQFVVGPYPKSDPAAPRRETIICKKNDGGFTEGKARRKSAQQQQQATSCDLVASETTLRCYVDDDDRVAAKLESHDNQNRCSMERHFFWQIGSDEKESSNLCPAQEGLEWVEDCDRRPRFVANAVSASFDMSPSSEQRRDLNGPFDPYTLASRLNQPTKCVRDIDDLSLCPTPGRWDANESKISLLQDSRWSGSAVTSPKLGSGLLGEALCRSQTRAREAEKKVQRAYEEKERLTQMFFKEASLAFTYRQWVTSLQTENMWLRMSSRHNPVAWLQHSIFNPFSALEKLSNRRWKAFGCHDSFSRRQVHRHVADTWKEKYLLYVRDPDDITMGYTLAFALGLSMAGAGVLLGWGMGWILLTY